MHSQLVMVHVGEKLLGLRDILEFVKELYVVHASLDIIEVAGQQLQPKECVVVELVIVSDHLDKT